MAILVFADAVGFGHHHASRMVLCAVLMATAIAGYLLVKWGYKRAAATLLVVLVWSSTTVFAFAVGLGLHSSVVYLYIPALLYTSLLCGLRAASAQTGLTIGALAAMHWAEGKGLIAGVREFSAITTNFNYALGIAVSCIGSLVIAAAYQRSVRQAVRALHASRREIAAAHDAVVAANQGLERRVAERTAALEEKVDELEALNYSVAHDLRAPLRSINGFASRVRELHGDRLDKDGNRMLARVASESLRMDKLLMALLHLGRLGGKPVEHEQIDLSALARRVAEHLAVTPEGAKVSFLIEPGLAIRGDALLLQTVLENLLANAAKFSRGQLQPVVEFGRVSAGAQPVFFVNDNGVGFDQAHARQLFRPFFRLHTEGEFEGIGIGLASVQRILRKHHGRIWATGKPGCGATFYFSLPAAAAVAKAA
jgi:signal transduction histidine kinase